eukprot:gnl/Dysnectes_brevis/5985_a8960_381.p1 GENE.gnl/Dysnectes_brevis/5985_a8960_381~~gnl/Dysnectes_brevis/5985_a8960_381.p1  ORF type:complete len:187 (-),score=25.38 gnl/Dysnectes_brevis/5985_a8960_381:125-685(-)
MPEIDEKRTLITDLALTIMAGSKNAAHNLISGQSTFSSSSSHIPPLVRPKTTPLSERYSDPLPYNLTELIQSTVRNPATLSWIQTFKFKLPPLSASPIEVLKALEEPDDLYVTLQDAGVSDEEAQSALTHIPISISELKVRPHHLTARGAQRLWSLALSDTGTPTLTAAKVSLAAWAVITIQAVRS